MKRGTNRVAGPRDETPAESSPGRTPEDLKPLIESVKKSNGLLGPYDIADHLQARIDEFGLAGAIAHLREYGYAVMDDVAPPEEMDELREAIRGLVSGVSGHAVRWGWFLLGRHPAIDRMATNPKILALAEVIVGNGMRAGQFTASIMGNLENLIAAKAASPVADGIHADQNWMPAPFPEHNCLVTFCIPCEGMTEAEGATRVVPGSHRKRRHPTREDCESETVPIEVKKGGAAVWDGSVWHGQGLRRVAGQRTVLHATYQRLYTQPMDDYSHLLQDEAYLASAPEGMRGLLGERLFFGSSHAGSMGDIARVNETCMRSKL